MIGIQKQQLINLKLPSNIFLIDQISNEEKYNYIQQCEALLLPSSNRAEAFGYSLLEGLFFHKPLISSEIKSGTSYINQHLKTGYVLKDTEYKDIIHGVEYINSNSSDLKDSDFVHHYSKFDPKKNIKLLYDILSNIQKTKLSSSYASVKYTFLKKV